MADLDSKEPLSQESENSFVILGPGSLLSAEQNNSLDSCEDLANQSPSSQYDLGNSDIRESTSSDRLSCSEGNIQEKLNELVRENYQLKETLCQNNTAIKSQLDTFFMWQQEVLKTHETHKRKFLETKDLILKLRSENMSMKKQLDELLHESTVGDASAETSGQSTNLENVNIKMKSCGFCSELFCKNEYLYNENQKLLKELEEAKAEKLKLQKELEDMVIENLFLKQKNENMKKGSEESMPYKSLPNAEARAQISNLFKQLEEEKEKTLKLKAALEKAESSNNASVDAKLSATEELNDCINKLDDMNLSMDRQNERFSGLNSWVTLAEENLKKNQGKEKVEGNLMSEMKEFRNHLNVEENASKMKQESVQFLQQQFTRLLYDYKILQQQYASLSSDENEKSEKFKKEITDLSVELETKGKELESKEKECDDLKKAMEKLKSEFGEKINVLEIQVDVYRSDFNCEREARRKVLEEKEKLEEQVQILLIELKNSGEDFSLDGSPSDRSPLESPGRKSTYTCPKCMNSFPDLRICEQHVDDCFNVHMYP